MPTVEAALAPLRVGEISPAPVPIYLGYLLIQRVDLTRAPVKPAPSFQLPSPTELDVSYILRQFGPAFVEEQMHLLAQQTETLELPADTLLQVKRAHEIGGMLSGKPLDGQLAEWTQQQTQIRGLLGPEHARRYRTLLTEHFERLLLSPNPAQ
jgi:hypothetical protein